MRLRLPIRNRRVALACSSIIMAAAMTVTAIVYLSPRPALMEGIPFSTAWYDRNGTLLRLGLAADDKFRLYTPLDEISPDLVTATLTQEDRYFHYHPGVNPLALMRAPFETYVARSRPMGGSTVTMQVVRLRDGLDTRTISGKLTQIFRALQLERHYSKAQILEAYLNLAPYGGNIHGAGAASLIYFRQPAKNLAMPQSLGLAVIPQNPIKRFPLNEDNGAWQEARLRLFGHLPDAYEIYAEQVVLPLTVSGRDDLPFRTPHFVESLKNTDGGITKTTLDYRLQNLLEKRITAWLQRERRKGLDNAAAMLVHFPSMEVRALVGSGDFFDAQISGQVDGTLARRSPGSTLKPFIYALALDQGLIHPQTLLSDDPAYFAEYRPGNFDKRFIGKIPAAEALRLSRNVPAISLAASLEEWSLYDFLQEAGAGFPKKAAHYGLSVAVGGAETDMRTLVKLYAMLANGGVLQDLKYIKEQDTGTMRALLSPEAALLTLTMLEQPDPDALPFAAAPPLPIYWKTGTSNGFRDAWTVGVFGPYVLAVWTGHFDGRPSPALVGLEAAAPLFFDLAYAVMRQEKLADRIKPALEDINLAKVAICRETGMVQACRQQGEGWFIPGKSPIAGIAPGKDKPEILSPRGGLAYVASKKSVEPLRIPLEAKTDTGSGPFYWFANNTLIGVADGKGPLFWEPEAGAYTIRFVDDAGRSASASIRVITSR